MKLSLNNKHAILCGSTDGIGKASALLMAQRGASLTLVARNQKKLDQTLSELSTDHGQVHFSVCADFNEPDQLKEKITNHMKVIVDQANILVNNSGGPHGGAPQPRESWLDHWPPVRESVACVAPFIPWPAWRASVVSVRLFPRSRRGVGSGAALAHLLESLRAKPPADGAVAYELCATAQDSCLPAGDGPVTN